jgi:hypothetical protein
MKEVGVATCSIHQCSTWQEISKVTVVQDATDNTMKSGFVALPQQVVACAFMFLPIYKSKIPLKRNISSKLNLELCCYSINASGT